MHITDGKNIYNHLQDEISKFIFGKRLLYSMTGDKRFILEMIESIPEVQALKAIICQRRDNFIFGAGNYGRIVCALAPAHFLGIVDNDVAKWGKSGGVTIVPPQELYAHPDSRIFLATRKQGKHYQDEIAAQLDGMGIPKERIVRVDKLIDELERKTYFDLPNLPHEKDEIFVDAGGYDGGSSKNFAEWARSFKHIYAFEPDPQNISVCEETLQVIPAGKATVLPYGVWQEKGILRFRSDGTIWSSIESDGNLRVPVTSIDEELGEEHLTFIKMDIEGSELSALKGAEQSIRNNHPKLAISIYHRPEDIFTLPALLLTYHPDYKFYLRHYSLGSVDTVLYAI